MSLASAEQRESEPKPNKPRVTIDVDGTLIAVMDKNSVKLLPGSIEFLQTLFRDKQVVPVLFSCSGEDRINDFMDHLLCVDQELWAWLTHAEKYVLPGRTIWQIGKGQFEPTFGNFAHEHRVSEERWQTALRLLKKEAIKFPFLLDSLILIDDDPIYREISAEYGFTWVDAKRSDTELAQQWARRTVAAVYRAAGVN